MFFCAVEVFACVAFANWELFTSGLMKFEDRHFLWWQIWEMCFFVFEVFACLAFGNWKLFIFGLMKFEGHVLFWCRD